MCCHSTFRQWKSFRKLFRENHIKGKEMFEEVRKYVVYLLVRTVGRRFRPCPRGVPKDGKSKRRAGKELRADSFGVGM